jgi:CheY-like chemotaxis protein
VLQGEGATVQIANHGQEGVEAIARTPHAFDVVLMDLQMPVMDGMTATRSIRTELGLTNLPIVAMTANAMASDRDACLEAGMNDHVGKPFDLNDLVRVLRQQARWSYAEQTLVVDALPIDADVAAVASHVGVDLSGALRRLGGKQEVYQRMLATFVNDLQGMATQLRDDAAQGNAEQAKRLLHTLKGLAATLGASALATTAGFGEKRLMASVDTTTLAEVVQHTSAAIDYAGEGLQELSKALQAAQTAQPGAMAAGAVPIDVSGAVAALQAMEVQLRESDMQAMQSMAELQQQFGEALGERISPLQDAMADMDFEQALIECSELKASLV